MSAAFIPLTVTAHTPAGFAAGDPWSPSLDGILAWAFEKERLGPDFGTNLDIRTVTGLPLATEACGEQWWYACGLPEFTPLHQRDRHMHRRFNDLDAERFLVGKRRIETAMGAHKNMRKPRLVNVAGTVTWKAVGDPAEIRRLFAEIPAIGSGWSRGLGRVAYWTVREGHEGEIRRWVPADYARALGMSGRCMMAALRPPARLPENQTLCVLPNVVPIASEDLVDFFHAVDALSEIASGEFPMGEPA